LIGTSTFDRRGLPQPLLSDIFEWDVTNWSRALALWNKIDFDVANKTVLELGARRGGLSLLFALNGARVLCSDVGGPDVEARRLHSRYSVQSVVDYLDLDATDIDLPDSSVDLVCLKSVLGGVGRDGNSAAQAKAVEEIRRVLRPSGHFLFAENLLASPLHSFLRRRLTGWGASWRYPDIQELRSWLVPFASHDLDTWGCVGAFGRTENQRRCLGRVDSGLCFLIPLRYRYVAFGSARK
jgi:SAM-dependent methyltransferase